MWNQLPPAWGWPPSYSYQYQEPQDSSQGWAAAAALWVQQRQMQEQFQGGAVPQLPEKPPEPPGLPPQMPPLPPPPKESNEPPLPSSQEGGDTSVTVRDYNHGHHLSEVVDYKHGKASPDSPPSNVIEYNHGQTENQATVSDTQTWEYNNDMTWHPSYPPPPDPFFNNEWNQWTQKNWTSEQANYFPGMAPEQQIVTDVSVGRSTHKLSSKPSGFNSQIINEYHTSNHSSPDIQEVAKKSKSLPLWLRQGLEKLEKDKQKEQQTDKNKEKPDLPNAKLISGYQMASSPPSSSEEGNEDSEDDVKTEEPTRATSVKKSRFRSASPEIPAKKIEINNSKSLDVEEDEDEDEEEKQKQLILKIKTWMTEILLSVTNNELKEACNEVYFEMKRSAKTKGEQLRRSGGLDALRSGLGGGASSSEDEDDDDMQTVKATKSSLFFKKPELLSLQSKQPPLTKLAASSRGRNPSADTNSRVQQLLKDKTIDLDTPSRVPLQLNEEDKNLTLNHENLKANGDLHSREKELKKRLREVEKLRKMHYQKNENSDVETSEESSDSSRNSDKSKRKKKFKKRARSTSRTRSHSPSRRSRKKSQKTERHDSSSSETERSRRRKKKTRERSPSSDDSSYSHRKKKTKGKKHKRKERSISRSPPRHKRKR